MKKSKHMKSGISNKHYKELAIQPTEYIYKNNIPFCEGNVIKYVSRWRDKGGVEDLKKAISYIEYLIEQDERDRTSNHPIVSYGPTCFYTGDGIERRKEERVDRPEKRA